MLRRTLLKKSLIFTSLGALFVSGLLKPLQALAAWPRSAFTSNQLDETLQALYGTRDHIASDQVSIKMASRAETGHSVSIRVSTTIPFVDSISIMVEQNNPVLAASFRFVPNTERVIFTRLRLSGSGKVIAVVSAEGRLYSRTRQIRVAQGACVGNLEQGL